MPPLRRVPPSLRLRPSPPQQRRRLRQPRPSPHPTDMSYLNPILNDLREKRLWPIALVLLAPLVAIPVLLSSSAKPVPVPHVPQAPPPPSSTAVPSARGSYS